MKLYKINLAVFVGADGLRAAEHKALNAVRQKGYHPAIIKASQVKFPSDKDIARLIRAGSKNKSGQEK